jgi:hypothetical protein
MPNADMDMEEKKNKLLYDDWNNCWYFYNFYENFWHIYFMIKFLKLKIQKKKLVY